MPRRCPWSEADPLLTEYHDREWGVPRRDERRLFEDLVLDGAQAGLSWLTILRKREAYREAFAGFDPEVVAGWDEPEIEALLGNEGIVRNRQKITSALRNARAVLSVREEHGSFSDYIWSFVDGEPVRNAWRTEDEVPASTPRSETLASALKTRGFSFVGPTICYAFMQAVGMVNDHLVSCFRHDRVDEMDERGTVGS